MAWQDQFDNDFDPDAVPKAHEKNGIRLGERVVCVDVPRVLGTVTHCDESGVRVRWDDGTAGDLIWSDAVGHNAYRLQIVRHSEGKAND